MQCNYLSNDEDYEGKEASVVGLFSRFDTIRRKKDRVFGSTCVSLYYFVSYNHLIMSIE